MKDLLSEDLFNELFIGKDFVFLMKKVGDDYQYIRLNKAARDLLSHEAIGKMLSTLPLSRENISVIQENYNQAITKHSQVDYVDYAYYQSEVRKYETSVRPFEYNEENYVLAITKEILYDRSIEDKFLFLRSMFDHAFFSTVILSADGAIYEVNSSFTEDFALDTETVKQQLFVDLPIVPKEEVENIQKYLQKAAMGENIGEKLIKLHTLDKKERVYLISLSPVMQGDNSLAIFLLMKDCTQFTEQKAELRSKSHGLEVFKAALNSAASIAVLDSNANILEVNDLFLNATGFKAEELIGQSYKLIEPRYNTEVLIQIIRKTLQAGKVWRGELCYRTKFHADLWVEAAIVPLKDEFGKTEQYLSINYDITDKKRMLTELKNIERTFRLITENTNDLIVITNEDGIIIYASPSYQIFLGYENVELQGQFYSTIVDEQSKNSWQTFLNNYSGQTETQFELLLRAKDGTPVWTEGNVTVVHDPKREKVSQIMMVSREITHRKERENDLLYLAYHDTLTQLPNRRFLQKEFPKLLAEAQERNECLAMLYIDGDDFKHVNDQYGHDTGDDFIRKFGQVLITAVRNHDLVIRMGGDEFIVVLTGLTRDEKKRDTQMMDIINRIRNELKKGWTIERHHFAPTASIGIAYYPDHAQTLNELLELADQALYKAKEFGKNNYYITDN
ncbi:MULTISPECIES: diguanylate cyclase [unclassified Lysinibacillus]|uniref:diguanylate cyclase domain-containing protein n=1 Tax=unclassified Lysinibacillus TaxID=2636778 RepID=UPI0020114B1E|nr:MULTISPECIES: diguanylate cyclase [unclassified Lysinibacillus]MCL1698223.1 diguanylate cyclase [Lysinibacillus sp. BPa_S21]MCL1702491.1 diguanylate cyclase [Lysinibacillus sp. Bpr_S20]